MLLDWLCNIADDVDLCFLLKGMTTLLDNPQILTWLPGSQKSVNIYQGMICGIVSCRVRMRLRLVLSSC